MDRSRRAFLAVFVPTAALLSPLFFHEPFSTAYGAVVAGLWGLAAAAAWLIGRACAARGDFVPAHTAVSGIVIFVVCAVLLEGLLRAFVPGPFEHYATFGHERSAVFGFEARKNHAWEYKGAVHSTDRHGFRTHTDGAERRLSDA